MTNFDDIFLEDAGLVELQKAMEDPEVAKAVEEARIRAAIKNLEPEAISAEYSVVDENTEELDTIVEYLLGTSVRISGALTIKDKEDNELRIIGDDMSAEFRGFVADATVGKLEYKYFFQVYVKKSDDEAWRPLTRNEMLDDNDEGDDDDTSVSVQTVSASFEDVHLSFDILHPVQAFAWLSLEYPEVIKQIDNSLFGSGNVSAEKQLLSLKNFTITLPEGTPSSQSTMLMQSLREYVFTLITLDTEVAYGVVIDGDIVKILVNSEREPAVLEQKSSILNLMGLIVQPSPATTTPERLEAPVGYGFALRGVLHELDPELPGEQVIIPLRSVNDIKSLRDLFSITQNTGENS